MDLMGVSEIAKRLGVSRQRASQLTQEYEDFPEPVSELAQGRVWRSDDIEAWIERHPDRRPGPRSSGS